MTLKPLSNNLILRRSETKEQTTPSGLLLSASPPKPRRGTVIAAGPGRLLSIRRRRADRSPSRVTS